MLEQINLTKKMEKKRYTRRKWRLWNLSLPGFKENARRWGSR